MGAVHRGALHVGCSGWHYKSWRGVVYDRDLAPAEWLRAYTRRFDTVELNNTFYRLPAASTFAAWRDQVPETFSFAMKASRFLTHIKRLRAPDEPLTRLLSHAGPLGADAEGCPLPTAAALGARPGTARDVPGSASAAVGRAQPAAAARHRDAGSRRLRGLDRRATRALRRQPLRARHAGPGDADHPRRPGRLSASSTATA